MTTIVHSNFKSIIMKKLLLSFAVAFSIAPLSAQTMVCNPSGNLMIYSCYDGGHLNINVDANIPNLKIGVVSYEAMTITLSGTYVNNVTGVAWAGYNGTNNPCGVITTTIVGAPAGVTPTMTNYPPSPVTNANGYSSIICAYSCSTATNQGGCNTIDQIEAYFHGVFPSSSLYAHNVQYGCWTGTQNVSAGGTCCTVMVGVSELSDNTDFSVYPNPANDLLEIKIINKLIGQVYTIADQLGRVVMTGKLEDEDSTIKVNQLAAGVYIFNIGQQKIKIIKQ